MFYVIEHQKRPDGVVNCSETSRTTFAGGVSLYHERYSKMAVNEQFVSVALMLVDEDLTVIEQAVVETQYAPPTEGETDAV